MIIHRSKSSIAVLVTLCALGISEVIAAPLDDALSGAAKAAATDPSKLDPNRLLHKDMNTELDVPPVHERPLGVDAGERIHVRKFKIKGVVDHPEFGISQESVDKFVEDLRIEIQNLNVMNEFGLSQEDMEAAGRKLQETLYIDDEQAIEEYRKFRERLKRAKRYREEMSIGQLQEVANKLTDFYRQSGLVIAQVFVPEQTVEDGVVTLHVLEGDLGGTVVEGNEDYDEARLKSPFRHLEHKPVTKEALENALLTLSDFPGLIAYGVLQPGVEQGETDLLVKVQEEIKHEYAVKVDNYGNESTGANRLTFLYNQNNVFGNADLFKANLLQTFSPANTFFGGVEYRSPIGYTDYQYGIELSSNAFDVGGGNLSGLGINGKVFTAGLSLSKQLLRSRRSNYFIKTDISNRIAETLFGSVSLFEDNVTALGLELGFDTLDVVYQGINQGNVRFSQGLPGVFGSLEEASPRSSREGDGGVKASSDFSKLTWTIARLQLINKHQNILLKTTGQYSSDLLPPVEQFGMGGPNNVRAFTTSEYLRDSAIFASIDWNFNAPGFYDAPAFSGWKWGEILQLTFFVDWARGSVNLPLPADYEYIDIGGYGIAAQLILPGEFTLRLDISTPFDEEGDDVTYVTDVNTGNYVFDGAGNPTTSNALRTEEGVQYYLTFTYTGF